MSDRSFITVQSVRKMGGKLQEWSLGASGWHVQGSEEVFDLTEANAEEHYGTLFYKERWEKVRMQTGEILEMRYIVTFSFKYRDYLSYVRDRQIDRRKKSPNDAKRFIRTEYCTEDGELAQVKNFSLNQEMIEQEARFDGFYCICTDLEGPAAEIIRLNSGRWVVENDFRITKTDMDARPVYREILGTLRDMNFLSVDGEGYIPAYERTDLTNHLHGSAGFRTDTQIVTKKKMRSIIASTKKREKETCGQ